MLRKNTKHELLRVRAWLWLPQKVPALNLAGGLVHLFHFCPHFLSAGMMYPRICFANSQHNLPLEHPGCWRLCCRLSRALLHLWFLCQKKSRLHLSTQHHAAYFGWFPADIGSEQNCVHVGENFSASYLSVCWELPISRLRQTYECGYVLLNQRYRVSPTNPKGVDHQFRGASWCTTGMQSVTSWLFWFSDHATNGLSQF